MKHLLKTGFAVGLGLAMIASSVAAQSYDVRQYDGYCYIRKQDAKREGAVTGAIIGGLIGSQASKHERGLGTIAGAIIGGVVGGNIGRSSVRCYNDEYYAYQGHYYEPSAAPSGYIVMYYRSRPGRDHYSHVYYDRQHHEAPGPWAYGNAWHDDGDNPNGWRDDHGYWHDGRRPDNRQSDQPHRDH